MWKSVISSSQQAARAAQHPSTKPSLWTPPTSAPTHRTFSAVAKLQKETGAQAQPWNRESLNPQRTEVSQSGTDSELAHHDSAFDPSNVAPESELEATEQEAQHKGKKGTLNMSPANKDVHAWKRPEEGGPDRNADRGPSSRGSPSKRRTIHVKEDGTHVSYR